MRLFYFFEDFDHFLLECLSHTPQPICIALIIVPLFLSLHDIESFGRKERIFISSRFGIDSEIKFVVGRRLLSPPFLVLNPRHFYFGGLGPFWRLGDIFIVFVVSSFVLALLLCDFFFDFIFKFGVFFLFSPFNLLLPAFNLLHLETQLLLILKLLPGLALGFLRVGDEESAPEGLIVSDGDF